MARYFKFHSLDDIRRESESLGLDISFQEDLSPLFQPVQIGTKTVGNALCIQPMEGCDGTLDGKPDELTIRRYQRFGAGGAKIIWGEATAVREEARANSRQLLINDTTLSAHESMFQGCLQAHRDVFGSDDDLLVGLQLTHSGRYSYRRPLLATHDPYLDPRTIVDKATGKTVDNSYPILSDDDLKSLVDDYVKAAKLAHKVGYQFVDVKQCHRYLLSEMLASKNRPGPYGGSLENRTRLARDIFTAIRSEVPDLRLATRMNAFDSIPFQDGAGQGEPCSWQAPLASCWGTSDADPFTPDLSEPIWWVGEMVKLGVSLINISMGNPYASPHIIRPFEYPPPDGYETPEHPLIGVDRHFRLAAQMQRAYPQVAMVGSGYSYLQQFLGQAGAANIANGRIKIVGVGRASLPMPDFAKLLQEEGEMDRKRICRTFSYCTALMRAKHNELGQFATGCPPFDKEIYGPIWEQAKKKPN